METEVEDTKAVAVAEMVGDGVATRTLVGAGTAQYRHNMSRSSSLLGHTMHL